MKLYMENMEIWGNYGETRKNKRRAGKTKEKKTV